MSQDIKRAYAGSATSGSGGVTSLGSSSTWVAGYEWFVVDNTTALMLDYELAGQITVGTSPAAGSEIRIYLIPSVDGSTYPDVFDGTPSAETVTSAGVRDGFAALAKVINVDTTTSDRAYPFHVPSVAALFGGNVPKKFAVWVSQNTGAALNGTGGNHTWLSQGEFCTAG